MQLIMVMFVWSPTPLQKGGRTVVATSLPLMGSVAVAWVYVLQSLALYKCSLDLDSEVQLES